MQRQTTEFSPFCFTEDPASSAEAQYSETESVLSTPMHSTRCRPRPPRLLSPVPCLLTPILWPLSHVPYPLTPIACPLTPVPCPLSRISRPASWFLNAEGGDAGQAGVHGPSGNATTGCSLCVSRAHARVRIPDAWCGALGRSGAIGMVWSQPCRGEHGCRMDCLTRRLRGKEEVRGRGMPRMLPIWPSGGIPAFRRHDS